ncbi:MAG TPA: hypothetical protein DCQ31_04525 [Bacteroidales bacterium]|nr:hypothetical protein [Bacteroidales bacterium]
MSFFEIYLWAFAAIMALMTSLWIASVYLKNVSIVDMFWGVGFVVAAGVYYYFGQGYEPRKLMVTGLVAIWGLRLSVYLAWRNVGKPEDFRYQEFRRKYGAHRYWYVSFFQTFLLQGVLMWFISAPLLGAQYLQSSANLNFFDYLGVVVWLIGFTFEAGGDYQLARFKGNAANKGKVLQTGFWKYTRHPNYFGDSAVWWAFGLFALAAGSYFTIIGAVLMTALIIKVSGVALLEKSLKTNKPEYAEYIRKTSTFIPWFPKK